MAREFRPARVAGFGLVDWWWILLIRCVWDVVIRDFRAVSHSSSYLPFIFASSSRSSNAGKSFEMDQEKQEDHYAENDDDGNEVESIPQLQLKGRRMFNDRGEEVDPKAFEVRQGSNPIHNVPPKLYYKPPRNILFFLCLCSHVRT